MIVCDGVAGWKRVRMEENVEPVTAQKKRESNNTAAAETFKNSPKKTRNPRYAWRNNQKGFSTYGVFDREEAAGAAVVFSKGSELPSPIGSSTTQHADTARGMFVACTGNTFLCALNSDTDCRSADTDLFGILQQPAI